MHDHQYHDQDLSKLTFLITGGAGFIGSNLAEYLLASSAAEVRVLDNLCEGKFENIEPLIKEPNFQFIEADMLNVDVCRKACAGVDFVNHQAALGSVPRSIEMPLLTNDANVTGFLNVLTAAKDANVKRIVYASSSSVYGDNAELPKTERHTGNPLSPYAATKLVNEVYAGVYGLNYDLEVIGLRYFNIFGPRQKPDGPYAAVIPLFMDALLNHNPPKIFGDGEQSRDFTYVANAVQANVKAMLTRNEDACGEVYNIACGERTTVNDLFFTLRDLIESDLEPIYLPPRQGDIPHSHADISKAARLLGYKPDVDLRAGLQQTFQWFRDNFAASHDLPQAPVRET